MRFLPLLAALALSGCLGAYQSTTSDGSSPQGTSGEPDGGAGIQPPHGEETNEGLRLIGDGDTSGFLPGGHVTFTYTVTNEGADAITHGACERPYTFTLRDGDGNDHPMEVPTAHCLAFSNDPFPSGATYAFNKTWDGTYAVGDHMEQAPAGPYTLLVTFLAYRDDQEVGVAMALQVNVLSAMGEQ